MASGVVRGHDYHNETEYTQGTHQTIMYSRLNLWLKLFTEFYSLKMCDKQKMRLVCVRGQWWHVFLLELHLSPQQGKCPCIPVLTQPSTLLRDARTALTIFPSLIYFSFIIRHDYCISFMHLVLRKGTKMMKKKECHVLTVDRLVGNTTITK